jgi:regulator of nucleoside diphosphate kinase
MEKILFSTDQMPSGMEVKKSYSMVQVTGTVEISNKGLIRGILERNNNEYQKVMNQLISFAPSEANAIIGVQISTAVQNFNNSSFLYISYIGTPAIIGHIED